MLPYVSVRWGCSAPEGHMQLDRQPHQVLLRNDQWGREGDDVIVGFLA